MVALSARDGSMGKAVVSSDVRTSAAADDGIYEFYSQIAPAMTEAEMEGRVHEENTLHQQQRTRSTRPHGRDDFKACADSAAAGRDMAERLVQGKTSHSTNSEPLRRVGRAHRAPPQRSAATNTLRSMR